jgi:DNA-binding NtrC family response regulator
MSPKVLIVDDEKKIQVLLKKVVASLDVEVATAGSGEEALETLSEGGIDLIISDLKMPGIDGLELLRRAHEDEPDLPFILMTAFQTVESAVDAMKLGAIDYVIKPFENEKIKKTVQTALDNRRLKAEVLNLKSRIKSAYQEENIIGGSDLMRRVVEMAKAAAQSLSTVLIRGESGTGKELIANLIHLHSDRSDQPMIKVNCAAIPENLLESELFGHRKGAFTGAVENKRGKFEQANKGTIFLDEIGDMSSPLQAKILRVLQQREFQRLGDDKLVKVDVKIIAATNIDLEERIREGEFRQDLFYRLNVIPIFIPPLRERKADIVDLVYHFLGHFSKKLDREVTGITREALDYLAACEWPGNVRELENAIERAMVLGRGEVLDLEDVTVLGQEARQEEAAEKAEPDVAIDLDDLDIKSNIARLEKALILKAIDKADGVKKTAAKHLGISGRALSYYLDKYDIKV